MKNIRKQLLSCCLFLCCLLCACGTESESPDTLEDILNPHQQETEQTTTQKSFFFQPETELPTRETDILPAETEPEPEFSTQAEISSFETNFETNFENYSETETVTMTSPPETAPVQPETFPETEISSSVAETTPLNNFEWEILYREFLESGTFKRQISADVQEADTRFLLLYLNQDDTPELLIQTTMEVLIYSCHQGKVAFVDSFYPSHYTYVFYYRPYHNCLGSLQGSVMSDGTYLEIYEFEDNAYTDSGLAKKETYCYPTREYSYEIYAERGMNIDLTAAPELDIFPERANSLGSSWITVPDVLENSNSVQRYEITEEGLAEAFGNPDGEPQETEIYDAFRQIPEKLPSD